MINQFQEPILQYTLYDVLILGKNVVNRGGGMKGNSTGFVRAFCNMPNNMYCIINSLDLEMDIEIVAHHLCKM